TAISGSPASRWLFASNRSAGDRRMPVEQSGDAIVMTPAAAGLHDAQTLLAPGDRGALDLTIFVSCYNELPYIVSTIETIRSALAEVGGISYEIIVIDDRSGDGSADLVEDHIRSHPDERILLRRNRVNRGLAQNYFDAAFLGAGKHYRLICGDN